MLLLQLPRLAPRSLFTKLSGAAVREVSEFRQGLPTFVCVLTVVAGATLYLFSLLGLILSEGEPFIWDCQGKLIILLNTGSLLGVFGSLFLPILLRSRGYQVGLKHLLGRTG